MPFHNPLSEWELKYLTVDEMEKILDRVKKVQEDTRQCGYQTLNEAERQRNLNNRAKAKESRDKLKAFGRRLGETLEVGDLVRVVGVRNTTYNWRLVTEVTGSQFTGWQVMWDRRKKRFFKGRQVTTMQTDNIREVKKNASI